jgi:hypothetical protein
VYQDHPQNETSPDETGPLTQGLRHAGGAVARSHDTAARVAMQLDQIRQRIGHGIRPEHAGTGGPERGGPTGAGPKPHPSPLIDHTNAVAAEASRLADVLDAIEERLRDVAGALA